ncbi:shikimate dehydrogenase [Peptococcaceae bacterium SCADC1_2_3]|jgi:shikimate dehydrogenase|nr:shikimate dehydrogenase [Peptococcaceae bacterium SCADC1_2_3]KFI35569.1 shikimate dehydrogenase [Peptococcaceae bacterium SCADC1_2_3]
MQVDGKTKVCGIFGFPVEHSFSPRMQNAAFSFLKLNYIYVPFAVPPQALKQAVAGIRALNLAGVNITIPHKEQVISFLDEITPSARIIGAVNTIVNQEGRLIGHNTDGAGFLRALKEEINFQPAGKKILLLGAGGGARAVAVALALAGANQFTVANQPFEYAVNLARLIKENTGLKAEALPWLETEEGVPAEVVEQADLIVQATPVGMYPYEDKCLNIPFNCLRQEQVVCDLIYNPPQTLFLKRAAKAGARVKNGLGMLLYQGALAFELWTGKPAPAAVMQEALKKARNEVD